MNSKNTTHSFGFRPDLHRWQHLVSPAWVAALIADKSIPAAPAKDWCLLEVGFGMMNAHLRAHIPGAGYIDTSELEYGPLWNKVTDAVLMELLLNSGIRHDTTVVLYGRNPLAAARAAHLMLYAGVEDVRLIDGGYAAWTSLGLPLEQGLPTRFPAARDFGADYPAHPEFLVDMRLVKTLLEQPDACLVSIRTWNEFIGKTSGYS